MWVCHDRGCASSLGEADRGLEFSRGSRDPELANLGHVLISGSSDECEIITRPIVDSRIDLRDP
jgi:hypothetical protein